MEGRRYIDLCAGFGALPLGHNSQALREVMAQYTNGDLPPIEHGMGDVYPSQQKVLFLETIKKHLPKRFELGSVALSGGQAVEVAVKTAMLATKNRGFIVFDEGYHGLDLGILPLTSREDFRAPFEGWIDGSQVMRLPFGASSEEILDATQILKKTCGFAAALVEPLQGRAGVRLPPSGWLEMMATTVHEASGLLILDEVFTGFGRIGSITSSSECDADLVCFGKAIGGGFPISACFGTKRVMNAWPESTGEALHTGTFFGHPFSASVGYQTMQAIEQLGLVERSRSLGQKVINYIKDRCSNSTSVKDVRGVGLMIGIEFHQPGAAAQIMDDLRGKGVIVLPSGRDARVLSLTPALNIEEALLFEAIDIIF